MGTFIRYSDDELNAARNTDMVDFLSRRCNFHFKSEGGSYRCTEHNSLVIDRNRKRWYWNSHNQGGNNALDWLQSIEYKSFHEACALLINRSAISSDSYYQKEEKNTRIKAPPDKPFVLPKAVNGAYKRVYAYLAKTRNIDPEVIKYCFDKKIIYQDEKNNAVFVGYNENGVAVFGERKGTNSEKQFRGNLSGSDKKYSFHINSVRKEDDRVFVFEAPIDLLAHCTINNMKACAVGNTDWQHAFLNHNRLSLSGTSIIALNHYLTNHKEIKNIVVCTDNDDAGKKCAESIAEKYGKIGYSVISMPAKHGKDYGEYLDFIKRGGKNSPKSICSSRNIQQNVRCCKI